MLERAASKVGDNPRRSSFLDRLVVVPRCPSAGTGHFLVPGRAVLEAPPLDAAEGLGGGDDDVVGEEVKLRKREVREDPTERRAEKGLTKVKIGLVGLPVDWEATG